MNKNTRKELGQAFQKSYILLILFITSIVVGVEYHRSFVANPRMKEWQIEKFQKSFNQKENEALLVLKKVVDFMPNGKFDQNVKQNMLLFKDEINEKGFAFYIYKNDTINFWSSNSSDIPFLYSTSFKYDQRSIMLGNAIYYSLTQGVEDYKVVVLFKVKGEYSIQNSLLKNDFLDDFSLSSETLLNLNHCLNCIGLYNNSGKRVFSIEYNQSNQDYYQHYKLIYLLIIIGNITFLILFLIFFIRNIKDKYLRNVITLLFIFLLVLIRLLLLFKLKNDFSNLDVFSPYLFAASDFLSSLGDLILHSFFFFIIVILFYENFTFGLNRSEAQETNTRLKIRFFTHFFIVFMLVFWFENVFYSIIHNSNISFEIYKVLNISKYTFFALLCVITIYFGVCIFYDKIISYYTYVFPLKQRNRLLIITMVLFVIAGVVLFGVINTLFYVAVFLIMFLFRTSKTKKYTLSRLTVLVMLFTGFSVFFMVRQVSIKQVQNKKVLARNLATEHDYIAEMFLERFTEKLKTDHRMYSYMSGDVPDENGLREYIIRRYFGGYLSKYKLQILICKPQDSVYVTQDQKFYHCYSFFDDEVNNYGASVPNSAFYFMHNANGRVGYYFGNLVFNTPQTGEFTLFVDLQSKLISTELGYPELLIAKEQDNSSVLKDYSYAKYHNDELVSQNGDFQYPLKGSFNKSEEYEVTNFDGYNHIVYFPDDDNVVIISTPQLVTSDLLFTFSYLFLFFILSIGVLIGLYQVNIIEKMFVPTFRNKIQFSMILVLIISLILIGGFTIYYSAQQYRSKHYEFISEKLQSVQIELEHKLSESEILTRDWYAKGYDNLDELLKKFSNVFFSDIHLYDPHGNILASSRPEIFSNKIQGSLINPDAYFQLVENNKGEFIHNEEIGELRYLSGYIPFFNQNGDLLAYLNLPYFTRQKIFTGEITSLIIAVLNIYVFLFLITIAIAFVMSEQITRPLKLIQNSFRRVKLGIQNEPIQYKGEDEIAGLVNEYNRMVIELSENAEKLAKSEREMAWREMARQIAHEIKNPLTPMKLNMQQLQRAWKDRAPNWGDLLSKVSTTMIEQINTLSSIATEFSNFAKMPQPKNEVVELVSKLKNIVKLFDEAENIRFVTDFNEIDEVNIYADKEQVLRVFTNLVKNAIQSIPEGKKGQVKIELLTSNVDKIIKVKISDNGRGIPEEIHNKLFQPNFTTKSSGMGLGLAIVKKIVDTTNGNIYFTSEEGVGTVFTVEWEQFN